MAYVNPAEVLVPRNKVRSVRVIYDSGPGEGSWSAALLNWGGVERVGLRWNGDEKDERGAKGNPQSHGRPTWFVVPNDLAEAVREAAEQLSHSADQGLLDGYGEMAKDRQREIEADEWSEGLIGSGASEGTLEDDKPPVGAHEKRRRSRAS